MNRKLIVPLSIILVLIAVVILIDSFWHTYKDTPVDSDAIVILGGGDQGRVEQAADLYKSGYADKVIITPVGDRYTSEELVSIIRHYGIEEEDIIVDKESTSTYTNAQQTIEIMAEHNFKSAMIVTNDYHIKRSKLIFDRQNDGGYTFNYIPATNLDGDKWYEREDAYKYWIGEFIKVWGYRLGLYKIFGSI